MSVKSSLSSIPYSPRSTTRGALISNAVRIAHSDSTAQLYHPKPSRYTSVPRVVEGWSATDDAVGTAEDCTTSAGPLLQSIPRIWCPDSMESSRSISTEAPSSGTEGTQFAPLGTIHSCPTTPWVPVLPPKHHEYLSNWLLPQSTTSSLSNALCSDILPPAEETQPALLHSLPTTPAMSQAALSSSPPETPHLPLSSSSSPPTALCSPASCSPIVSHTEDETQSVPPGTIRTLPPTPTTHASFLPQESDVPSSLYTPLATPWMSVPPSPSTNTRFLELEPASSLSAARASPRLASLTPSHTEDATQLVVPDATPLTPAIRPRYSSRPRKYHGFPLRGDPRVPSSTSSLSVHNKYFSPPNTSTALPLPPSPLPLITPLPPLEPQTASKSGFKHKRRTHTKWKSPARFYVVKSAHSTAPRRIPIVTGKFRVTKPRAAGRVASPSSHSGKHKQHLCRRGCGYSTDLRGDIVRHNKTCSDGVKEFFCIGKPVDEIPDSESIVEAVEWPGAEDMLFAKGCGRSYARKDAYNRHLKRTGKHGCVGDSTGAWWVNEKVHNALALATAEYVTSFVLLFAARADDRRRYEAKQKARRR